MRVWAGSPYPLGATWDGDGVNFAIFSEQAKHVDLVLFTPREESIEHVTVPLAERTNHVWHAYLPGVGPGQLYGYRVHGDWAPQAGLRFNDAKVVVDPYARAIGRDMTWHPSLFAFEPGSNGDGSRERSDSAAYAPLGLVIDATFDWEQDARPATPWRDTVIYELHVRGSTIRNPDVPPDLRGTFLGVASPAMIRHFRSLGVTAVELMPVHAHVDERALVERGLVNYWGYNSLAYFAPDARFTHGTSPGEEVREFKTMVKALHAAGLEVILDVVYNHTGEGDYLGPTLSLRGIDNRCYYRLDPGNPARYEDFTGTGNTLNMQSPAVLQLLMDSLRYWIEEMHVDGFRFDLASALARELFEVDRLSSFFDIIGQDPVISRVKLIAEPWDLGAGGYQVGNFPPGWTEWNGRYRDAVRRFWRGDSGMLPELASRLAGSSDLYNNSGRLPHASINFVTCHDGFTLADLVSYDRKHNDANGEGNRDGDNHNLSWNCGVEGPSSDPDILALRERQRRNFMLTLLVSIGVPMYSGGDELGRTQDGNNNAYCQDNGMSWTRWPDDPASKEFLTFVQILAGLRAAEPVLRRRKFLSGRGPHRADVLWLGPDGKEMDNGDWSDPNRRTLGVLLDGHAIEELDAFGEPIHGNTLFILLHAGTEPVTFSLPLCAPGHSWEVVVNTATRTGTHGSPYEGDLEIAPHSAVVLRSKGSGGIS
jgi:glycogen operon protein